MYGKINRFLVLFAVMALVCLAAGIVSAATVTPSITYQGKLTNAAGSPLTGTYTVTFKLYDTSTGSTALSTDTHSVTAANGLFTTPIAVISPAVVDGRALWLGIKVGADAEMTPRQEIRPVPYALSLRPGAFIDGVGLANTRMLTANATGEYSRGLASYTSGYHSEGIYAETTGDASSGVYITTKGYGSEGVRAYTSGEKSGALYGNSARDIGVYGIGKAGGIYGESTSGKGVFAKSSTDVGVWGEAPAWVGVYGNGSLYGVEGMSQNVGVYGGGHGDIGVLGESTDGVGVWGSSTTKPGVYGLSTSDDGVHGYSQYGTGVSGEGATYGLWGKSTSGTGVYGKSDQGQGVYGESPSGDGVKGYSTSGTGVSGEGATYGLWGKSQNYGVYGESISSTSSGTGVRGKSTNGRGVFGTSVYLTGVEGTSNGGVGVSGTSIQDAGVKGESISGSGVYGIGKEGGYFTTNKGGTSIRDRYSAVNVSTGFNDNLGVNIMTNGYESDGVYTSTSGYHSHSVVASTSGDDSYGVWASTSGINSDGVVAFTSNTSSDAVYASTLGSFSEALSAKAYGGTSRGVDAYSEQYDGIYTETGRTDNKWGLWTPDYIYAKGTQYPATDVAEYMPVVENATPGTVLIIGDDGRLAPAKVAYDDRVAGIVSTDPGVFLGAKEGGNDGEALIAIAGRVPCKVDAGYGAIHPGDVLTTSDHPGYAMKAEKVSSGSVRFYMPGTVLGKAMGTQESGTGTIEVLVTLQ